VAFALTHSAVEARRYIVEKKTEQKLDALPFQHYDYANVWGQCCENVIGYAQIPVGVAGPLRVDEKDYYIPLATTEGALVASTTRGCKALTLSGGVTTEVVNDGMTRAPVLQVENAKVCATPLVCSPSAVLLSDTDPLRSSLCE
jgi:hydroxymethylglutaryl-CoA reductase (NADPH)